MIIRCGKCRHTYDDEFRSTECPHETFMANDGENNFEKHEDSHLSDGSVDDWDDMDDAN